MMFKFVTVAVIALGIVAGFSSGNVWMGLGVAVGCGVVVLTFAAVAYRAKSRREAAEAAWAAMEDEERRRHLE
jgi:uncharacterized membrane protein